MRIGVLEHRIQFLQLDPGVLRREPPAHLDPSGFGLIFPRLDFSPQHPHFVDASIDALTGKDAQDGNRDATSIDVDLQFWYHLVSCREQRE